MSRSKARRIKILMHACGLPLQLPDMSSEIIQKSKSINKQVYDVKDIIIYES